MPLAFLGPQCQMSVAVCLLISEIIMSVLCLELPSVKKDLCGFWSVTSVGTAVLSSFFVMNVMIHSLDPDFSTDHELI